MMKRMFVWLLAVFPCTVPAGDGDFALTLQGMVSLEGSVQQSDMNRTLEVRLYGDAASADTCLWARTFPIALATNGLFSVTISDADGSAPADGPLGSCTNLLAAVLAAPNHEPWVSLKDDKAAGEMQPRIRLSKQPRALTAMQAMSPADGFTVGGKLVASDLEVSALTTTGDIRSPDITIVNSVESPDALNVGSAAVDKTVAVAGSFAAEGRIESTGLQTTTGCVTAASASAGTLKADVCTLSSNATVTVGGVAADFPIGSIAMWSGDAAKIPSGWRVCDGEAGTPDLRDRFIVGTGGGYSLGDKGGAEKVTLTAEQIPKHNHAFTYRIFGYVACYRTGEKKHAVDDDKKKTNWTIVETQTAGDGQPHENRPPYYALYFIQRVK